MEEVEGNSMSTLILIQGNSGPPQGSSGIWKKNLVVDISPIFFQ